MKRDKTLSALQQQRFQHLYDRLAAQGHTQQQIAGRANTAVQYISDAKHGRRPISELLARRLGEAFNFNHYWLLGQSEIYEIPPVKPAKPVLKYKKKPARKELRTSRASPIVFEFAEPVAYGTRDVGVMLSLDHAPDASFSVRRGRPARHGGMLDWADAKALHQSLTKILCE